LIQTPRLAPMELAHMELVWPSTKVHLYVLEAAHVKKAVGRERIRRNKDALRELCCLQEILSDLHAGQFGRAPERRSAAEVAASRWDAFAVEAQRQGLQTEVLLTVPQRIRPLLVSRTAISPGSPKAGTASLLGASSSSTRAPSTATGAQDADMQSVTTDGRSEATSLLDGLLGGVGDLPGPVSEKCRRSREQLECLAEELREQLDQEYTSLMTSIEEVQSLMEAEVAGDAQLPSIEELEDFTAQVDQKLEELCKEAPTVALEKLPKRDKKSEEDSSMKTIFEVVPELNQEPIQPSIAQKAERPRWADMCSDSDEAEVIFGSDEDRPAQKVVCPKNQAAQAQCSRCRRFLGKSFFSRRAWRQVRGLGSEGNRNPESTACHDCSGDSSKGKNGSHCEAAYQDPPKPRWPAQ